MSQNPFLYLRGLRHVAHTVFNYHEGQKAYRDPQFRNMQPYASGQQVKRNILEAIQMELEEPAAPITFNWQVKADKGRGKAAGGVKFEQKEVWAPCDPSYIDQLLGGYMRAEVGQDSIKRRSPLSISAMRPLHPLLGVLEQEGEAITYDRMDRAAHHFVRVRNEEGEELAPDEVQELIKSTGRILPSRTYMPEQKRASGLFVYDIALDLRTLFCVSTDRTEVQLDENTEQKLLADGWLPTENYFGPALVAPSSLRERVIPALSEALLTWRIRSNQSRTFSLQETLAIALSPRADELAGAIRARLLGEENERPRAKPILDETAGAELYIALPAEGVILNTVGKAKALALAKESLIKQLSAFDYENQLSS